MAIPADTRGVIAMGDAAHISAAPAGYECAKERCALDSNLTVLPCLLHLMAVCSVLHAVDRAATEAESSSDAAAATQQRRSRGAAAETCSDAAVAQQQ